MGKALFVTATGTDVGKTYVTALLLKTLREQGVDAGYYKAALSGAERINGQRIPGDAAYVCAIAGLPEPPLSLVSYCYDTAASPHLAARLEGNPPVLDKIAADFEAAARRHAYVCVEGSGGIVCPLRIDGQETLMLTDVIRRLGLGLLIVAGAQLGTINSTVLTVSYARALHIPVSGIILNRYEADNFLHRDNREQIQSMTGVPVVACVADGAQELNMDAAALCALFGDTHGGKGQRE